MSFDVIESSLLNQDKRRKNHGDPHRYIEVLMHEHRFQKYPLTSLSFSLRKRPLTRILLYFTSNLTPVNMPDVKKTFISQENQCFRSLNEEGA